MREAFPFMLRLMAATAGVLILLVQFGDELAEHSLPLLRWTYSQLDHDHEIREFSMASTAALRGTDKVFLLEVVPDGLVLVGTQVVHTRPDGWARVSVLTAYLWQSISVALVCALAWPTTRRSEWGWRMVLLAIFCVALAMLDVPFVLWAQVWRNYADVFAPGEFSVLLVWADFLQRGGRFLLGGLGAACAILVAAAITRADKVLAHKDIVEPQRM